jgi:hypothetical protein
MAEMKKVYRAKLKPGLGFCKVFAWDEEDAKRAALVTYLYNSAMCSPNPRVEDVVESVELDPDQVMDSCMMQPTTQIDCRSMISVDGSAEKAS